MPMRGAYWHVLAPLEIRHRNGSLDPPSVERNAVWRQVARVFQLVPIGHPDDARIPVRDDVMPPQQDPVEGRRPGPQAFAIPSGNQQIDEAVDRFALYSGQIAAAGPVGGL